MATQTTRGKGNLYDNHSEELVSAVSYQIHEELTTDGNLEKWWGELTFEDSARVPDGDRYVIELEDKRRGQCSLRRRINKAVILVPSRYFYRLQGTGPLNSAPK